jgi:hypothetical protein
VATSLEKWRAVLQTPEVVGFFRGTFERAGVRITDTNEAFTCLHLGDRIEFEPALVESRVDFTVPIESYQVERLAHEAKAGELSEIEQFRVLRALFSPATAATLKNPVLSHGLLRRLAAVEDLLHVHLHSPDPAQEPDATHTLVHAAGQWLVFMGLHGRPRRTFHLSMKDAIHYQRRVFHAMKKDDPATWLRFAFWYLTWRKRVSSRHS